MAANVIESIHKLLVEFETHPRELADLCDLIFSDVPELRAKFNFSGPPAAYATHLIKVLASYGRLSDNTPALVKLLEALKAHWGVDKQTRIDRLITEFEASCADSPPQRTPQTLLPIEPNPYRGLHAFREEDADLFFGRDAYIAQLAQAVQDHPFTAVIGASGSGKSSLVWAGLLPRLRQQGNWQVIAFRPGLFASERNPLLPLSLAVRKALNPDQDEIERLSKAVDLAKQLKNGDCTLTQILSLLRDKDPKTAILVFADQFEELYTTCPDLEEQHRFLDVLLPATGVQTSLCRCILTMRADFLSKALAYRPFADALQGRDLKIGPMQREELRQAIEQPAGRRNVQVEDGLTDRILDAVAAKPGELPLVQFTLTELWLRQTPPAADRQGRLTHAAYEAIGGVQQALAQYADRVYATLSKEEQQRTQYIFTQLVQPGAGTEDTKRIATRAEIGEADWPLVAKLADARLVVTGYAPESPPGRGRGGSPAQPPDSKTHPLPLPGGELVACGDSSDAAIHPLPLPGGELAGVPCDTVDVAHEALIRGWQRLREWIDADREFRAWQERLRSALRQWQASHYDDGALLRGAPLAEAEQWLHQRTFTRPEEPQFIQASLDLRDREQREREAQQQRELKLTQENLKLAQSAVKIQTRARKRLRVWLWIVVLLSVLAGGAAVMAYRGFRQAVARSLVAYAYKENNLENRETAALLALQASRLDPNYEEIEKALDEIFRTKAIVKKPGDLPPLKQVCEKVKFRKALTSDEWKDYTGGGVSYKPACDESQETERIKLRSAMMIASDLQALSLNLRENGRPGHFLDNKFESQGDVVIDHATGLMWQQSGSPEYLTYEAAKKYIDQLNRNKFGGFDGWRLPTVEELLSLVEEEENGREFFELNNRAFEDLREEDIPEDVLERLQGFESKEFYDKEIFLDALQQQIGEEYSEQYTTLILKYASRKVGLYIDPVFDARQWWCWSADEIKSEGSSGSAWGVYFDGGLVRWNFFHLDLFVRAVRSRQ